MSGAIAAADRYTTERTISRKVKTVAQTAAWLSVLLVALATGSVWITMACAIVALACTAFMVLTPSRVESTTTEEISPTVQSKMHHP